MHACHTRFIATILLVLVLMKGCTCKKIPRMAEDCAEFRLMKNLFDHYDKEILPVLDPKKDAVLSEFEFALRQIVDLDEQNQVLTANVWIRQVWTNPWLQWNVSEFGGIESVNVSPELVWRPDLVMYNNADGINGGEMYEFKTKVELNANGKCKWYAPTLIKGQCKIKIKYFPFDEQYCIFKFGSWTYTGNRLNLTLMKGELVDLSMYTISGEWDLLSATAKRNVIKYSCCPNPYIDLTFTIHLRRRILFYLNNLIIPSVLLTCLTVFSFQLPPDAGERISLLITALLGMTVFMLIFTQNIPPSSEEAPLMGKYFLLVLSQMGASLICTCVSLKLYHQNPNTPIPSWLNSLVFKGLAPLLRMKPPGKTEKIRERSSTLTSDEIFVLNCNRHITQRIKNQARDEMEEEKPEPKNKLEEMILKLDKLCEKMDDQEDVEEKAEQWHFICQVLDKVFFWVFLVTVILSTYVFAILAFFQDI